jgi:hypothetical protein
VTTGVQGFVCEGDIVCKRDINIGSVVVVVQRLVSRRVLVMQGCSAVDLISQRKVIGGMQWQGPMQHVLSDQHQTNNVRYILALLQDLHVCLLTYTVTFLVAR